MGTEPLRATPARRFTVIRVWKDGVEIHGVRSLTYTEDRPDPFNEPEFIVCEVRFETTNALEARATAARDAVLEIAGQPALLAPQK